MSNKVFQWQSVDYRDKCAVQELYVSKNQCILVFKDVAATMVKLVHLRSVEHCADWSSAGVWLTKAVEALLVELRPEMPLHLRMSNVPFTMVPDSLFSKYSSEHYLLSTSKPSIDFSIQSEYIEPLQQHCVYESPKFLAEVLSEFQVQQSHWTHGFLLNLVTAGSAEARVYAIFNDRTLTVAVTSGHNLLFLNEFQYISATDALYYVLLAYQESGLEPLANELVLLGEINTNGEIYNYLRTYISKIQVVRDGTLPEEANYYNYLFTNQFI